MRSCLSPAAGLDEDAWPARYLQLGHRGYAVLKNVWTPAECAACTADDSAMHAMLAPLRDMLYTRLAGLANDWQADSGVHFPATLAEFQSVCQQAGQRRPLSGRSRHGIGECEYLHQDSAGVLVFPLQAVLLLSAPGRDFSGGETVLTEQRPRMQSRVTVLPLQQGDLGLFATHWRPVSGSRGVCRVNLRHGVSRIRSGQRQACEVLLHDGE